MRLKMKTEAMRAEYVLEADEQGKPRLRIPLKDFPPELLEAMQAMKDHTGSVWALPEPLQDGSCNFHFGKWMINISRAEKRP